MTDLADTVYTIVSYNRQTLADSLKQMILSGNLDTAFVGKIRFGIGAINVFKYLSFTIGVPNQMSILLNETAIRGSQTTFTQTLAHEIAHLYYAYNNMIIKLKWSIIEDLKSQYNYSLGNELGKNGACSAGTGHEKYNPENTFVCETGNSY